MAKTYRSRINRQPSELRMKAIPATTVMVASLVTALPIITDYPILPPLGLLVLLAWRLIQPGYWPIWAGFPLGLFDDIFSGQPFGSAAFLWSMIFIAFEALDRKAVSRDYWQDWLIASLSITAVLICGMLINDFRANLLRLDMLVPQVILSILAYPFIARFIGAIDNWRVTA